MKSFTKIPRKIYINILKKIGVGKMKSRVTALLKCLLAFDLTPICISKDEVRIVSDWSCRGSKLSYVFLALPLFA